MKIAKYYIPFHAVSRRPIISKENSDGSFIFRIKIIKEKNYNFVSNMWKYNKFVLESEII